MDEVLFRRVTLVDGTGGPPRQADVFVADGVISAVAGPGTVEVPSAVRVVEAEGSVLAPGFIDMHAHSDLALLRDPVHEAKLSQGVTTEVIGQDGIGYAPVGGRSLSVVRRQIRGWNGDLPDAAFEWSSVEGYLARLDRGPGTGGTAVNAAYLVPQGNLRMLAIGFDNRPATGGEISVMQNMLADAFEAGAVGMSSGLSYAPGMYASTAELEALCAVIASYGGYFAPHIRSYGQGALDSYAEVIDIARRSGCALHLTHATLNFDVNRDAAPDFITMIDRALQDGIDLTLDSYPYLPGATTLSALLPSWVASGGPDALLARVADASLHARITYELNVRGADGFHGVPARWDAIEISGVENPDLTGYVGRTITEIARSESRDEVAVVLDILQQDQLATGIIMHVGHEHNVQAVMRHRVHTGGSDGILVGNRPHPRAWGTFPRYLARYVRDLGVLTLEEAVHHLTGAPAARLGLANRGLIQAGLAADLVLFDPDTVLDTATFDSPRSAATGISHVMVNGRLAIDRGLRTQSLTGRVLRGSAYRDSSLSKEIS